MISYHLPSLSHLAALRHMRVVWACSECRHYYSHYRSCLTIRLHHMWCFFVPTIHCKDLVLSLVILFVTHRRAGNERLLRTISNPPCIFFLTQYLKPHFRLQSTRTDFANGFPLFCTPASVSTGGGPRVTQTRFSRSFSGFVCVTLAQLHSRTRGPALSVQSSTTRSENNGQWFWDHVGAMFTRG